MSIANNIEIVPTVSIEHVDQPNVDRTAETLISVTVNPPICIDNPDILNDLPVTPVTNRPENLDDKCDTLKIYVAHIGAAGVTGLLCWIYGPQTPIFLNGIKNGSGLIFSCSGGDKTHPNPNCLEINILFGCINLLGCLGNFCRNHPNERYVVVPYAIQTIEPTS
tara:strand:+ start:218 stop:712 length:495 start_codon:yes stop_codon:yes gene_type:complete